MSCCGYGHYHTHREPLEGEIVCIGREQDFEAMRDAKRNVLEVSLESGVIVSVLTSPIMVKSKSKSGK